MRLAFLLVLCLVVFSGCGIHPQPEAGMQDSPLPLFRFGLLADVQYADKNTIGARRYRDALDYLETCVDSFFEQDLEFVVHCGDIIDGRNTVAESNQDLDRVLHQFSRLQVPVRHVIGNHCLEVPRDQLMSRLKLPTGYYSFVHENWRFVVVDSMEMGICGVPPEDPRHQQATAWLASHPIAEFPHAQTWNGGLGVEQRKWLQRELQRAEQNAQSVVIFSHHPVAEAASTKHHLLWDYQEVLQILDRSPAFTAWINGHDHAGGFAVRNGRAHLTLPGMVEAKADEAAFTTVHVYANFLSVGDLGTGERIIAR